MNENRVVSLRQKDEIDDPFTEILRAGARKLIAQAVEIEFDAFLATHADLVLADGRQRVVRHGHDPVRTIQTGIGPVQVQKPKARDRGVRGPVSAFVSRLRSCRNGLGERGASMRFCRLSICAGFRRAISRKFSRPCSARTRRTSRRR